MIYHITTKSQWEAAQAQGFYDHPSLAAEGFIHCSEAGQVAGVLERYFQGQQELLKLTINTSLLEAQLVHEWSGTLQESFPHIYGRINLEAVVGVEQI